MPKRKSDDTTNKAAEAFTNSIVEACNGKNSDPRYTHLMCLFCCLVIVCHWPPYPRGIMLVFPLWRTFLRRIIAGRESLETTDRRIEYVPVLVFSPVTYSDM